MAEIDDISKKNGFSLRKKSPIYKQVRESQFPLYKECSLDCSDVYNACFHQYK